MNMTIGNTSIEIVSCVRMRDTKRGFYLDITIPKAAIGMEDLYNLLDSCTENIVVTDEEGNVSEYVGFKTLGSFACENGEYKIAQICTSEYEAQLSLAQSEIATQNRVINNIHNHMDEQTSAIEAQTAEIGFLNDLLLEVLMG